MAILRIENLEKSFTDKKVLKGINLSIEKGKIFGLLGPNGAGKTTLIRIITNIIKQDKGNVYLNNESLNDFHPKFIGYMPEERGLYKKMKVGEQLIYLIQLKGFTEKEAKKMVLDWMDKFEIRDWWNKKIEELSKGMQQKVQFIATIAHNPQLVILDEPFTGLDPVNTELIKQEIYHLKKKGSTIIFSTHRMEQVEEICEDLALINNGKIILQGKTDEIKQEYKENLYKIIFDGDMEQDILKDYPVEKISQGELIVKIKSEQDLNEFLRLLLDKPIKIKAFYEVLPSLNDIFIKLVS